MCQCQWVRRSPYWSLRNLTTQPDPYADELKDNNVQQGDIKIIYHPNARLPNRYLTADAYREECETFRRLSNGAEKRSHSPWSPFQSRLDYEVAQLMLEAGMNKAFVDRMIRLFHRCKAASKDDDFTLEGYDHVRKLWDLAAHKCTSVRV